MRVPLTVAGICFTVVIPTAVGMMAPEGIDPYLGWVVIGVSMLIGLSALLVAWRSEKGLRMTPEFLLTFGLVGAALCIAIAAYGGWRLIHEQGQRFAVATDRHLSKQQKEMLTAELIKLNWQPADALLMWEPECEECRAYALDFEEAFTRAGWTGRAYAPLEDHRETSGVKLFVVDTQSPPSTASLLALALREASIDFDWSIIVGMEPSKVYVWICRRRS
jgi:hypothetical protein